MEQKKFKVLVNNDCFNSGSRGVKEYYNWICGDQGDKLSFEDVTCTRWSQLFWGLSRSSDIIWSPSHATSILSGRHIVTVHDLINLKNCHHEGRWLKYLAIYLNLLAVFLTSPMIVCISRATESVVHSIYPFTKSKTKVINSPSMVEVGTEVDEVLSLSGIKFVLMVTNNLPHKNTDFILNNLPRYLLEVDMMLVVVSSTVENSTKYGANVRTFNGLTERQMNYLFRNCSCICSPSLMEGHNIVLAKGNYLKKPLLASDIPVHREYYPHSVFFDPHDPSSLILAFNNIFQSDRAGIVESSSKGLHQLQKEYAELFKKFV